MAPGKDMDGSARHIFHKHNRMSMKTVVVGAGGISNAWLPVLKTAGVDVAGIVDLDPARAKAQAGK